MATETTLVYLGHLLLSNVLEDLRRRRNHGVKLVACVCKICGLIISKRKAIVIRENEVRFLNVIFPLRIQLPEIKTENSLPLSQGFGEKQLRGGFLGENLPRIKKKMLRIQLYCFV